MLHIASGDCLAEALRTSGLGGYILPFREALMDGPSPAGLDADDFRAVRARHLASAYDAGECACLSSLAAQDAALVEPRGWSEVVLWFESDLFCQANLLYVLHRLHRTLRLSLVTDAPDTLRPPIRAEDVPRLLETRRLLDGATLALAAAAWVAWTAPDPTELEAIAMVGADRLPDLTEALRLHLARLPWRGDGLGLPEWAALQILRPGPLSFPDLFAAFSRCLPGYGLGDLQFWNVLRRLAIGPSPLLSTTTPLIASQTGHRTDARLSLTGAGRLALDGRLDAAVENGLDVDLGGVGLHTRPGEEPPFRFDGFAGRVSRT